MGGDEFAIVLPQKNNQIMTFVENIFRILEDPFIISNHSY